MLNFHNVHRNGSKIWRAGAKLKELHTAVCFRLSMQPKIREERFYTPWVL